MEDKILKTFFGMYDIFFENLPESDPNGKTKKVVEKIKKEIDFAKNDKARIFVQVGLMLIAKTLADTLDSLNDTGGKEEYDS